jgi:hypothetical protein
LPVSISDLNKKEQVAVHEGKNNNFREDTELSFKASTESIFSKFDF